MHSLELEVQVLKGKLAAGGRDLDTMRETLTSRITLLEGKLNDAGWIFKIICVSCNPRCVAQLSEKDSKIKEQLAQLQLTHQNDVRNAIITGLFFSKIVQH